MRGEHWKQRVASLEGSVGALGVLQHLSVSVFTDFEFLFTTIRTLHHISRVSA